MVKICALQLPTLSMSESRIEYYLKEIKKDKPDLILIGEYVLNNFLSELIKLPKNMIIKQSDHKKELFLKFAKELDIIFIAPLVLPFKDGFLKVIAKFSKDGFEYEKQNILISYSHWNEFKFFKNRTKKIKILKFDIKNIKFGVLSGYDAHFDRVWDEVRLNDIDCVLVPCASTFDSNQRWLELLKTRAFLNSTYILRANRVGKAKFGKSAYNFYGNSSLISPNGILLDSLDDNEDFLTTSIDLKEVKNSKKLWKFNLIAKKLFKGKF